MNKVMLIGRLTDNPEIRYRPDETPIVNFNLAVNEKYFSRATDEFKENTTFLRIVVWKKLAENCDKYLSKGSKVFVEGRIRINEYEKDGVKKWFTEIHATSVQFLDSKKTETETPPLS